MTPTRRRRSAGLLLVLFVAVPLLEIYVIIQVGHVIGAWWTILLLLADGAIGTWLVRREGHRAWEALTTAVTAGRLPSRELADGVLVLVGGTLMVAPGFVTDVAGAFCLLPFTRPWARAVLARVISGRLGAVGVVGTPGRPVGFGPATRRGRTEHGSAGDVVRGEVIDED